jgi:hypothetical protein
LLFPDAFGRRYLGPDDNANMLHIRANGNNIFNPEPFGWNRNAKLLQARYPEDRRGASLKGKFVVESGEKRA